MNVRIRITAAVAALLLAGSLAACGGDDEPTAASTQSAPSPTSTSAASPTVSATSTPSASLEPTDQGSESSDPSPDATNDASPSPSSTPTEEKYPEDGVKFKGTIVYVWNEEVPGCDKPCDEFRVTEIAVDLNDNKWGIGGVNVLAPTGFTKDYEYGDKVTVLIPVEYYAEMEPLDEEDYVFPLCARAYQETHPNNDEVGKCPSREAYDDYGDGGLPDELIDSEFVWNVPAEQAGIKTK